MTEPSAGAGKSLISVWPIPRSRNAAMNLHCSQSPFGTFRDRSRRLFPSRSASRRFARDKPWKARTQDGLGFRYEIADDLACRQDLVDQPGTLSPVQQGLVELPPL